MKLWSGSGEKIETVSCLFRCSSKDEDPRSSNLQLNCLIFFILFLLLSLFTTLCAKIVQAFRESFIQSTYSDLVPTFYWLSVHVRMYVLYVLSRSRHTREKRRIDTGFSFPSSLRVFFQSPFLIYCLVHPCWVCECAAQSERKTQN